MTARKIRSSVSRLVLVAGLAVALLVGSVAIGGPSGASAMPMTCSQALALARANINVGNVFLGLGDPTTANFYFGRAQAYLDFC